jgi:TPR repeat protein
MDSPRKFININTPIIDLIKCLSVIAFCTLVNPVFAVDKQDVVDACYAKMVVENYKSAFPLCKQAASQGNASAQARLGAMYYEGYGTPQDYKQAIYWHTKAAEQGDSGAQYNLAVTYNKGYGTPKDDKQAIYWYTKAAEQGHAGAQFNVGIMLYDGVGKPKDNVMAYVWWNIAAAQGYEGAKGTRELIEEEMTPNQIAEAQKLSKEYYAKYVK